MQQINGRKPMPKRDFNKVAKQLVQPYTGLRKIKYQNFLVEKK